MRAMIVLSAIVACAVATPGYLGGFVGGPTVYNSVGYSAPAFTTYNAPAVATYAAPAVATYAAAVPVAVSSQYQAQDTIGQYSYGYNDLLSAKSESRAADGSVAGAYSYIDGKGEVQKVQYKADSTGFHVDATSLPVGPKSGPEPVQDTPEVMEARAKHLSAVEEVRNRKIEVPTPVVAPVVAARNYAAPLVNSVAYNAPAIAYSAPAVSGYAYNAPAIAYSAPAVSGYAYTAPAYSAHGVSGYAYTAPAYTSPLVKSVAYAAPVSVSNQYHSQDILGQYSYGYNGGLSAKAETKTFDGVTRGGYSYVDANGLVQKVDYTADPINGFRVAGTNLPVGPSPVAASTVPETAEVIAAKAIHFRAHVEAKERLVKAL